MKTIDRDSIRSQRFGKEGVKTTVFLKYLNFSLSAKFHRFFIILGGGGRIYGKKIFPVDPAEGIWTPKLGKNRIFYR